MKWKIFGWSFLTSFAVCLIISLATQQLGWITGQLGLSVSAALVINSPDGGS